MNPVRNFLKRLERYLPFLFIIFFIALGAVGGYFYKNNLFFNSSGGASGSDVQMIITKVGNLVVLPTDEVPTVATVSDPTVLQNKDFFVDAKKGDVVLIYYSAKKAILYDPVLNKIINITKINVGDFSNGAGSLPTTIKTPAPGNTNKPGVTQF